MSNSSSTPYHIFGATQTLVSLAGCMLNALSFTYFVTLKPKAGNSEYFRRLYIVITFTDFWICSAMLPVVEAAFAQDREATLFSNDYFCTGWAVVWALLPQVSIFLIGMLSVSRLLVLKYPTRYLRPGVAFAAPATCSLVILAASISLLGARVMHTTYVPECLFCTPTRFSMANTSQLVVEEELHTGLLIVALYNVIPACSIIPISISFAMSLAALRRSTAASVIMSSSTRRQAEATKTVMVVTLMYIIFNIPYTFAVGYVVVIALEDYQRDYSDQVTIREYVNESYQLDLPVRSFARAVIFLLLVSLNSMINPLVYCWRMKEFQSHVARMWREKQFVMPSTPALPRTAVTNVS